MIDIIKENKKHLGGPSQYSMNEMHEHHIVPKYHCKKINVSYDFAENIVNVTRYQHAVIHWGYYCKNLTELKKHCNPPQWVLDMIPLGNGRDAGAAKLISLNEINQISLKGIKLTEEHKRKIGLAHKGRKLSEERKKSMSIVGKKRWETYIVLDETRKKISVALKGKKKPPRSEEHKRNASLAQIGKKHSEETIKKMVITHTGMKHTEESIKHMSKIKLGKNNPMYGKPAWNKGIPMSEEHKRKMIKTKTGKKLGPYKKKIKPNLDEFF